MSAAGAPRILIIRLGSLGDLVHTLPAAAALRGTFPEARIDWVTEAKWAGLIEMVEGVDEAIPLRRSAGGLLECVRRLRSGRYDRAIDFQGLYKSALLARFSGIRRRIGRDRRSAREPGAAWFYTETVMPQGRHVAEMNLSLARAAGATGGEMRFPLCVPQDALRASAEMLSRKGIADYVVLSPGGGWLSKCWPAERYGELCSALWQRRRIRCVINVGPGEERLARQATEAAREARPLPLSPSLVQLAALLARARAVVAADTGPLHLAAALGAPVVGLFGPTTPARNGPLPRGRVVQSAEAERDDLADARRGDYVRGGGYAGSMLSLGTEQVLAAVEQEMDIAK